MSKCTPCVRRERSTCRPSTSGLSLRKLPNARISCCSHRPRRSPVRKRCPHAFMCRCVYVRVHTRNVLHDVTVQGSKKKNSRTNSQKKIDAQGAQNGV